MRLALKISAPGVERVVHYQAVLQHFVVVGEYGGEAERDRIEASRLRRQLQPRSVGTADDGGQCHKRRIIEAVFFEEGVEAALLTKMAQLDTGNVIGDRAYLRGGCQYLRARHEKELGVLVDEPGNEPGAGNPVDLRALAGDPIHSSSPEVLCNGRGNVALTNFVLGC